MNTLDCILEVSKCEYDFSCTCDNNFAFVGRQVESLFQSFASTAFYCITKMLHNISLKYQQVLTLLSLEKVKSLHKLNKL